MVDICELIYIVNLIFIVNEILLSKVCKFYPCMLITLLLFRVLLFRHIYKLSIIYNALEDSLQFFSHKLNKIMCKPLICRVPQFFLCIGLVRKEGGGGYSQLLATQKARLRSYSIYSDDEDQDPIEDQSVFLLL